MSAEPSLLTRQLRPEDLFLIFASDGLWEQISDEEAVEIVLKNPRSVSTHHLYIHQRNECFLITMLARTLKLFTLQVFCSLISRA